MPVPLRPFQFKLKADIYDAWNAGAQNVMPVAATGSGKTVLLSDIHYDEPGASVAIAHRRELVSQISVAFARNGVRHRIAGARKGSPLVKIINALHVAEFGYSFYDPNARVGVGGVDTIIRMDPAEDFFRQVRLVTQDEAHHVLKDNKWGKAQAMFPNARGLFPTATPTRSDGRGLGRQADGLVDVAVRAPSMRQIIDMGYLTDYRLLCPPSDLLLGDDAISEATGDFNLDKLRKATKASRVIGDIVRTYVDHARGKLGVTFAVDVEAATVQAAEFRAAGVPAEVVSADTPDLLRAEILRRFRRREIHQLVNVDLFGEGFDLPAIECVSMGRKTASFSLFAQQFGRALRLMIPGEWLKFWDSLPDAGRREHIGRSDKPRALIFDHVGNTLWHMGPPDKRVFDPEECLRRREKRASKKSDAIPLTVCLECLEPYERVLPGCPHCGTPRPAPAGRSSPEAVDGDLTEYAPEFWDAMQKEIARVDGDFYAPVGLPWPSQVAARRNHDARRESQRALRNAIAWFAGLENAQGRGDSEAYRRFYFKFGVDVANAQTLGASEAEELRLRVLKHLADNGIDGTVDVWLYFGNSY